MGKITATAEEVYAIYKKAGAYDRAAKELGTSSTTLRRFLEQNGMLKRRAEEQEERQRSKAERVTEAYARLGTLQKTARELHMSETGVHYILRKEGVVAAFKGERNPDPGKRTYEDIDKRLRLTAGNRVLTPKGVRVITAVYPYHVAVKTKYGHTECFTKGVLLSCATAKAEGKDYRDKEDKE